MSSSKKLLQSASGFNNLSGSLNIEEVFSTHVYRGTGADGNQIINGIDLANEGGMVWIKNRDGSNGGLMDTARGVGKIFNGTYNNNAEETENSNKGLVSFNNNGFTLNQEWHGSTNATNDYVAWTFRKAPKFFDVVIGTTDNSGNITLNHSLEQEPGMVIYKRRDLTNNWFVYHRSLGVTKYMVLDTNTVASNFPAWSNVSSTTFRAQLGLGSAPADIVAYFFGHDTSDEGMIQCGTYNGSGSSGNTVTLGFEPQWVMIKRDSGGGAGWIIVDNVRGIYNGYTNYSAKDAAFLADSNNAEDKQDDILDITPTGFSLNGNLYFSNASGSSYIYMAIRKGPMAKPTSRADFFNLDSTAYTGADTAIPAFGVANFADFIMAKNLNATDDWRCSARLMGPKHIPITTQDEQTDNNITWDWNTGGWENAQFNNKSAYVWTRAPGAFDCVTYLGNGNNNRTINHNLGVVPEMIWHKLRNENNTGITKGWKVGSTHLGTSSNDKTLMLNTDAAQVDEAMFNDTPPTSSVFTVSSDDFVNKNNVPYLACLFASVPGISKIGTFSHTSGSTTDVDCGFSSGVYWVMIKRIDSNIAGQWYVYEVGMGINPGNEQTVIFDSDTYYTANADHIDNINSGFQVQSVFHATGTFLFYAMAN